MKKSLLIIAIIAVIIIGVAYAVSPYFTSTTVYEALPNSALPTKMEEKTMIEEKMTKVYSGTFVGMGDGIHDAQGIVMSIPSDNGNDILRIENFKVTNGPDLYVYLATDNKASEFVNLGKLKANNGNQNYEIPSKTDLEKYNRVLIWCKTFGVLFGNAELSSK